MRNHDNLPLFDKFTNNKTGTSNKSFGAAMIYAIVVFGGVVILYRNNNDHSLFKGAYLLINAILIVTILLMIKKSFDTISKRKHMIIFRLGLFFLLNSIVISSAVECGFLLKNPGTLLSQIFSVFAFFLISYVLGRMITQINKTYNDILELSLTDDLTGLPNRRFHNIYLLKIAHSNFFYCIADVDNFKKINDIYGHEVGDFVLTTIAENLKKIMCDDFFVSRTGGDEFSIIASSRLTSDDLDNLLKRASSGVQYYDEIITMSVGVFYKNHESQLGSVKNNADKALYVAKKKGKNCIVFSGIEN